MEAALFGYHATIMAYGQTSAGKTYTMFGPEDVLAKTGYLGLSLIHISEPTRPY